jgi:hypothetical protein
MMEYLNPYTDSTRWLRGNIHLHQFCSGPFDLGAGGNLYRLLDYDFVAITDHDQAHSPAAIMHWQRHAGLPIIPGVENGKTDHILQLGVHEVTPVGSDDYVERVGTLRASGGFLVGCHPQEYPHGEENIRRAADELDAIEIFNALREARGTDEERNVALWDELLTAGKRLWAVASDDFHARLIGPGQGWVGVQVPEEAVVTWQLLVGQMKKGAFYASTYPRFESFSLDASTLRVVAAKQTREIRIIGPGGAILDRCDGREMEWPVQSGLAYFRVEAVNGRKRGWSQPFYRAG